MSPDPRPLALVVDDHEPVRRLFGILAERHGYAPLLAASGDEAVEVFAARRAEVAVVVLDVDMPGMDGPRTLAALRELDPSVRCVFATGEGPGYTTEELAALGAVVATKPLSADALGAAMRAATS
jgi:two-component system, OmpR family, response regulator